MEFPQQFGKYTLLKRIATGGMAEIFLAKQRGLGGFEKEVAIKRLLPHHAKNAELVAMFLDEARIAAQLTHVNIAQIYDFGCENNQYYIAMEYVRGVDLCTLCTQSIQSGNFLPLNHAVRIMADICGALEYAHHVNNSDGTPMGIVHRDISPTNILLGFDGCAKLVDFGIAKAEAKAITTQFGEVKGKYGYMSPEQAAGEEVDARTDLFAVGINLYEITLGRRLFAAESETEAFKAIQKCDIPKPRSIDPRFPEGLERIILKALAREPGERYQTAGKFQMDLEEFLAQSGLRSTTGMLASYMRNLFKEKLAQEEEEKKLLAQMSASSRPVYSSTLKAAAQKGSGVKLPGSGSGLKLPGLTPGLKATSLKTSTGTSSLKLGTNPPAFKIPTLTPKYKTQKPEAEAPAEEAEAPKAKVASLSSKPEAPKLKPVSLSSKPEAPKLKPVSLSSKPEAPKLKPVSLSSKPTGPNAKPELPKPESEVQKAESVASDSEAIEAQAEQAASNPEAIESQNQQIASNPEPSEPQAEQEVPVEEAQALEPESSQSASSIDDEIPDEDISDEDLEPAESQESALNASQEIPHAKQIAAPEIVELEDEAADASLEAVVQVKTNTPPALPDVIQQSSVNLQARPAPTDVWSINAMAPTKVSHQKTKTDHQDWKVPNQASQDWIDFDDMDEKKTHSKAGLWVLLILLAAGAGIFFLLRGEKEVGDKPDFYVPGYNLTGDVKAPEPERLPTVALQIHSEPEGATIIWNGQHVEALTPTTIQAFANQQGQLRLLKAGYLPSEQSVSIGATEQTVNATLKQGTPATAKLKIESEPEGATVFIDGIERGKTPLPLTDVMTGNFVHIRLEKPGFLPRNANYMLKEGDDRTVIYRLLEDNPDAPKVRNAIVMVDAEPIGAEIHSRNVEGNFVSQGKANNISISINTPINQPIYLRASAPNRPQVFYALDVRDVYNNVHLRMEEPKKFTGQFSLAGVKDITVYVGPEELGKTPLKDIKLEAGTHPIVLVDESTGQRFDSNITVEQDKHLKLKVIRDKNGLGIR